MMGLPELLILDVGHGNCAIIRDTNAIAIIDCPSSTILMKTLKLFNIQEISHIFISHADEDHIGGLMILLTNPNIKVRNVLLNADALRRTNIWKGLRHALGIARKSMETKVHVGLTTGLTRQIKVGQVEIEILAPTPELAMSGVGGEDLHGNRLVSNSMSAVIGLVHNSHRVAILPGDIDGVGLSNLLEEHNDSRADILVFPHHGGSAGNADDQSFAQSLCTSVKPKLIVFSIDRNHLVNPREGIIQGIKFVVPNAHIMCTQLSRRCAAQVPNSDFRHLTDLPAKGRASNSCCGGTISIKLNGDKTMSKTLFALHKAFVGNEVATPMCLRHFTKE